MAGDVLIIEKPYVAVLASCNKNTHCSHCFLKLSQHFKWVNNLITRCFHQISFWWVIALFLYRSCHTCNEMKYCSLRCQRNAWITYHKIECVLSPLLKMVCNFCMLSVFFFQLMNSSQGLSIICERK